MARQFWSGQFQISLVSFGIQLFPATEARSEIHFHQLNRSTGERIRHQNVSGEGEEDPLDKDEIVKGYEYSKGEYVMIEPEDIENLRIPSRQTLEVTQFIDRDQISPEFFEKPYFVTPENPSQAEAFAVVRKAMQSGRKAALGKIAFGGREHLLAVAAPEDDRQLGMMAYTLRYAEELRDPIEYFGEIKRVAIDKDQLNLAQELIKRKTAPFKPDEFTDQYEAALRAMIDAKIKHTPVPKGSPAAKSSKVVNLMDALRKSVQAGAEPKSGNAKVSRSVAKSSHPPVRGRKLSLVPASSKTKAAKPSSKRKSA
jgi:DNA end-binding protein Ku